MSGTDVRTCKVARRSPRQERAKATSEAIQQATLKLLQCSDLDDITTNDIARIAGVSIGSLYQYFRNKEEIVEYLLFYFSEKISKEAIRLVDMSEDSEFHAFVLDLRRYIIIDYSINYRSWRISFEHIVRSGNMSTIPLIQSEKIAFVCDCIHHKFGSYLKLERHKYETSLKLIGFQIRQIYMDGIEASNLEDTINNTSSMFLKLFEWDAAKSILCKQ